MDNPYRVPREITWEEDFVNQAVESAARAGLHVEVYPEADYQHGGVMYSAVTMPQGVHDMLLEQLNAKLAEPLVLTPNQPQTFRVPYDRLPIECITAAPTYCTGYATARSALNASMRAFHVFAMQQKMQQPPAERPSFSELF